MIVTVDHDYAHALADVHAAFCDPEFYVAKFEALGDRNVQVLDSSDDEDGFFLELEREIRLDVPGLLRGVLGEWNRLQQSEHWQAEGDGYVNHLSLDSDLVPMDIGGTMHLTGDSEGCTNHIEMNVRATVPLVGRALEKFGADNTRKSLDAEYAFIREYLAERYPSG